jgi:outer membrane protein
MRFLTHLAALAVLIPGLASANELVRVYGLAQQNDTQLRAAGFARDAAREARPLARGPLLPQITGTGSVAEDEFSLLDYDRAGSDSMGVLTPEQTCTAQGGEFDGGDCTIESSPYNLTVSATQTLLNWELWSRYSQADDQVAAAEVTYRSAQQQLALRVTEAYFNLLAAADSVRFADAEKRAVERQLELAKRRFEVGLSAVTDVQEAQARYDLTVAQMIEAEQALASAKVALSEITGTTDTRIVTLKEEIPLLGPNPDSVNDWLKTAAENNLDVASARIRSEIADKDVSINFAKHYPTLNLNGTAQTAESSGFNQGEYADNRVTLQVNVPIFAGGATQAGVRQARYTHDQRLAELEGTRRSVERTTRNAYQGVIAGVSRVKALKQAVVSNTTALEASEVGLEVGTRTAVDVLNAQRELYRAQRDYSKSRYDYLLNILRLKSAAGQLTAKDLNEIDGLLSNEAAAEVAGG